MDMAEDKDTGQEDVEGHSFTPKTGEDGKKEAPGVETAKTEDGDDVAGHEMLSKNPEGGKKDAPGSYTP
jgi:hypothetical protein